MNAIVSVTNNWGIGKNGQLLIKNPNDMKFFRRSTYGHTIICGRKTFESFPHGALDNRRNIILSRDENYKPSHTEVIHSLNELKSFIHTANDEKLWLVGGAMLYKQLIDECTFAYVTFHDVTQEADSFFPNLDERPNWHFTRTLETGTIHPNIRYSIRQYANQHLL